MNGNATLYEIINKATDEVIPVVKLGSGDEDHDGDMDFIVHMPEGQAVIFTNPGFQNEEFLVRQRGSKLSPDSKEVVREDLPSVEIEDNAAVASEEKTTEEATETE